MKSVTLFMIIIIASVLLYAVFYMCIYTAALNYMILNKIGLKPEIRSKLMIGTPYQHVYVHVSGFDCFLNPFRKYSEHHRTYKNIETLKWRLNNWGKLYNPINDKFYNILSKKEV